VCARSREDEPVRCAGMSRSIDGASRLAASARYRFVRPALSGAASRRVLEWRARRRGSPSDGLATVVIVNWESLRFLAVAVHALRRYSPVGTRIIVVDNHSSDGSRTWLRGRHDVESIFLPANIHHGPAMDIGFLCAQTEFVVSLDVDAFPISESWHDQVLSPLREGAMVSGVRGPRDYVHPCLLAMRRARFLERRHSFVSRAGDFTTVDAWDTGESISRRERPAVHQIEPTHHVGPGWVGTSWGSVAYHNFYAVRHLRAYGEASGDDATLDWGITRSHAETAWEQATRKYLNLTSTDVGRMTTSGCQPQAAVRPTDETSRAGTHR
jgi:hypothetical protein